MRPMQPFVDMETVEKAPTTTMQAPQRRRHRKSRLRRSVLAMAALAAILILTLAAAVFVTGRLYRNAHQWTLHTYQVREQILQLTGDLQLAEMDARSYGLTGRDIAFQQYWRHIAAVEHHAAQLAEQIADNPLQVAAVRQLKTAIGARRTQFEQILGDYRAHGAAAAHADVIALVS
ncbi:MAG TPA: CHASE3 domain-containing protein [Rhodanobacteraceae bacterium]|nr:CHASE3 domain-containing protein [Rhodanobacteraceae bacterium]